MLSQGYLETKKMEPLLVFVVEGAFRTSAYEEFGTQFNRSFYDTVFVKKQPQLTSFSKALELQKEKPKKIAVAIYTDFCNTCRMMNRSTYQDTMLVNYLNKKYYFVEFNAQQEKNEITYQGKHFTAPGANGFPFHELALELTRKNFVIPALVILDEKAEILDVISFYQTPEWVNKIIHFYGDDSFKKWKWEDYLQQTRSSKKIK